jgi:hypothetical protein
MVVKIVPNESPDPVNKLASAELLFEEGLLSGLRLIGFSIWENGAGQMRTVSFPTRTFFVNGGRRTYMLLRPIDGASDEPLRRLILQTYEEYEQRRAAMSVMPVAQVP